MNGSFLAGAPREADSGAQNTICELSGALHLAIFEQPPEISSSYVSLITLWSGFILSVD
jgi:hypothetical protein